MIYLVQQYYTETSGLQIQIGQTRMKFLRVFQRDCIGQLQNIDPLTHTLSSSHLILSTLVTQMLQKVRDSLAMISTIGFSSEFFSLARKILLLDTTQQEDTSRRHQAVFHQLYLSTKIQIVPLQPIEWIYGQLKLRRQSFEQPISPIRMNSQQLMDGKVGFSLMAAVMGSAVVFVEAGDKDMTEQLVQTLKEIYEQINEIEGSFPKIIFLYNPKHQTQADLLNRIQCLKAIKVTTQIMASGYSQSWDQQYRLIAAVKVIIQKIKPKIVDQVIISARLMALLWSSLASQQQGRPSLAWNQAQNILIQQQSQQALHHYMSRIEQLTEGQTLLSCEFFREVEAKVRLDVMRQVTQRTGALSQRSDIMKTEQRLLEMREEIESRNQKAVIDWGKEFLKEAWAAVDRKIGKQIKTITALRQEAQIFVDFFRKKSDSYLTLELTLHLVDFLVPKLMEAAQSIVNGLLVPLQEQQVVLQTQVVTLSTESKDLRRKLGKEEGEVSRRVVDLKEKNSQLQANLKQTERSFDLTKLELNQYKEKAQQKLTNLAQQYEQLLKQKQQKIEQLMQTTEIYGKKASLIESELNRQKLLHQQTKNFYQETVQMLKARQAQVRDELQQMNLQASRQLDLLRNSSTKQFDNFQNTSSQLLIKISHLQQLLFQRDQALQKLKMQLQSSRQQTTLKEASLIKINELQVRNKILEQMESQCQMLKTRIKKIDEQLKRVTKQREFHIDTARQAQTKQLIAIQKMQNLQRLLQQQKIRGKQLVADLQTIKAQKEYIKINLQKHTSKMTTQVYCQAQDTTLKQKLKTALQVIRELQEDYNRVRAEYQWQRIKA